MACRHFKIAKQSFQSPKVNFIANNSRCELFAGFFHCHGNGHGRADHGVVAHADEAHHFHMGGHGGRTGELCVGVHAAHGVGHAVGRGAGRQVVRVEGTACAAAGGHGEVFFAVFDTPFFIGAGNGMLEAGGVGGVAGDGNTHILQLHDGHAFRHVVCAVALDGRAGALGIGLFGDDFDRLCIGVKLGFHIGEAVDAGDDEGGVFAQAV